MKLVKASVKDRDCGKRSAEREVSQPVRHVLFRPFLGAEQRKGAILSHYV